jgi:beta-lactamase class A
MKLAAISFVVTLLLAGCGNTTPTSPPPSPAGSPVAQVDASPPAVSVVQASPSSGVPAPSAPAAPQPTPTPDPEALRTAAAAGYTTASDANVQAFDAPSPKPAAEIWGQFAADLRKLAVPADTAVDLHSLIRKVTRLQAWERKTSALLAAGSMTDFYIAARHRRDAQSSMADAVDRVRSDLGLPALCRAGCPD